MGVRGKDKRTEDNLKRFHDIVNHAIQTERFSFVYMYGIKTNYLISSKGFLYKIENDDTIRFVRPYLDKDLHARASISYCINGKRKTKGQFIHVLVAKAFIPNMENRPQVHHIDGDPLNNDVSNLMWVTSKEHHELTKELHQYCGCRGTSNSGATSTDEQILKAIILLEENKLYLDEISAETGLSKSVIQKLRDRPNSWDYLKKGHDISKYNRSRRRAFTKEDIDRFINYKETHPNLKLRDISNAIDIPYNNIKQWHRKYFLKTTK